METIVQPRPDALQVSVIDDAHMPQLAVFVKRSYRVTPDGRCVPSGEPAPLNLEITPTPEELTALEGDYDIFPYKPFTDVVIRGHARSPRPVPQFEASVQCGQHSMKLAVIGDRTASLSSSGRVAFSDPKPIEKVPLTYARAYGGRDLIAERTYGNPFEVFRPYSEPEVDLSAASPFLYPRNSAGCGYLMEPTAEALEALKLPNLEDPEDRLTPERIAVEHPMNWPRMPMPWATDWFGYAWFPRATYAGYVPDHEPPDKPIAEVRRGYVPADILAPGSLAKKVTNRLANGASYPLQWPHLKGNESFLLANMHPRSAAWRLTLPGRPPAIWTDGRKGKLNPTQPVLNTVLIEPDRDLVTLVWCGTAPALRAYFPEELERMPFKVEWR